MGIQGGFTDQAGLQAMKEEVSRLRLESFVPGKIYCAKCNFSLLRTNLYMGSGTTGPGDSKTEPCPNGCGPLWPVTWEKEAREGWAYEHKLFEDLHAERDQLKAENESLQKDAERYRWFRDHSIQIVHTSTISWAYHLDKLIDDAMSPGYYAIRNQPGEV